MGTARTGKTGRATLNDIARQAGVSISTASLVLSDKAKERRISEEVSLRVRQAAARLDYSPNLLVRSLQRGRTHVLSFFNGFRSRSQDDLYMDRLSTAIEQAAGRHGYDILVYCDFSRTIEETYRSLNGGHGDGLLYFAPTADDPLLPAVRASRLPTVVINGLEEVGALAQVRDDMDAGMRLVGEALVQAGHRRIAALTGAPAFNAEAAMRVTLLRAFLAERGIEVPDRWVVRADQAEGALRSLLAEEEPPTALFCWHDRLGYKALELCEAMNVAVPGRLSLVGYDGLRWPAKTRHVLTSVTVDLDALAEAAVVLLDALILHQEECLNRQLLPVALLSGTTLAAPAVSASHLPRLERNI